MIMKDGPEKAHKGDLGNIVIKNDGKGTLEAVVPKLTLTEGPYTVGGRSIVFHEKADDFGQPVGNAGAREGCGIIAVTAN
jgi:Cu-Zn family superoxide dismutase